MLLLVQVVNAFAVLLSFIPEVERNGDLAHFIEFLFLNVKNNLTPDGYNDIPAFPF